MSDDQDSDYPRFVTCTGCGRHGHFRLPGRTSPEVNSKAEGRTMLAASVAQGEITDDQQDVLLPLLEASTIPEEADKMPAHELGDIESSLDDLIRALFAGELADTDDMSGIATSHVPGFRMAPETAGELPHGSFYTEHAQVAPLVFCKTDGRTMIENAKLEGMADETFATQLLTELEASPLPDARPTHAEFVARADVLLDHIAEAKLVPCACGNPILHAYFEIDGEKQSLPIASKSEGRIELFALQEDGLISGYAHGMLLVELEESQFPEVPPPFGDRTPPDEASALFH